MLEYIVAIKSGNESYFIRVPRNSVQENPYDRINHILNLLRERQMDNIGLNYELEYRAQIEPHTPFKEPPQPNMPPTPWRRGPPTKRRVPIIPPVGDPKPEEFPEQPPRKPPRRKMLDYN